jgi:hypothetical protein
VVPFGSVRDLFKPIGRVWRSSISTSKRAKGPDGSAVATGGGVGVDDEAIVKYDTIVVPIAQFSFSAADIVSRFDGDTGATMRGVVTNVTTNTINIKFDGDTCVSPYPKQGYGEYVVKRSYRAEHASLVLFGISADGALAVTEFHINEIMCRDYLEGDLLNFAMTENLPAVDAPAAVVSCYFVSVGSLDNLARQYSSHIDFGVHKIVLFPTEVRQHWSLLVLCTSDLKLYSIDSGRSKLFGHTDSDYGPAIKQIEALVRSSSSPPISLGTLARAPARLKVIQQPNGVDCGFHVLFNAQSLAKHVDDGNTIDTWKPPSNSVREINAFRRSFGLRCLALPLVA